MKSSDHERALVNLASIGVFIALMVATVWLIVPYLVTGQRYDDLSHVSPLFPIAVKTGSSVAVVRWGEYQQHPEQYDGHLYVGEEGRKIVLDETDEAMESIVMHTTRDGLHALTYATDDYVFDSTYAISDGKPIPKAYRFTGAYSVMYGFLVAFVGMGLFNWLFRRWLARRTARSVSPAAP